MMAATASTAAAASRQSATRISRTSPTRIIRPIPTGSAAARQEFVISSAGVVTQTSSAANS